MKKFVKKPPESFDIDKTQGITARLFSVDDVGFLKNLAMDPDVARYVPWAPRIKDDLSAIESLQTFRKCWNEQTRARYAVFMEDAFVGYVGLWPDFKEDAEDSYEFGYALLPNYRGKGTGSKLIHAIVAVGRTLGARTIVAYVDDANVASKAVVLKSRFVATQEFDKGDRRYELVL